jgi:multidrug resistance efflux pump
MKRSTLAALLAIPLGGALLSGSQAVPAKAPHMRPVLITGYVEATDSQDVLMPPSNSSPVVLRTYLDEGTQVKKGDVILRIDASSGGQTPTAIKHEAEQSDATARKEIADLEVAAVNAEKAFVQARAALAKARVDASLPKGPITAIDYDRYQGERERAERDLEVKQKALDNANASVKRRREDARLSATRFELRIAYALSLEEKAQVRASRDGVLVHGYSEWRGERFDEGSSGWPGNSVGKVLGNGPKRVVAYALEADRPHIREGQAMRLSFDALPGKHSTGKIVRIASAPEARSQWGGGRYFRTEIELPEEQGLALAPGMSVLVEPQSGAGTAPAPAKSAASADISLEGEIVSRSVAPVSPPSINEIWSFSLARLAPEGSRIKKGEVVAIFDAPEINNRFETLNSNLNEKQRALDKLRLDQAEAERAATIAVAEAHAELDKAARKATQPKELIRRIEYDKLVIDKEMHTSLVKLAQRQLEAQGRARAAELSNLTGEIARIKTEIAELEAGKAQLTVKSPRDGVMLYRTQFNGEKFVTGSKVFRGLSVASIADPANLVVDAKVPEVQAGAVKLGQAAKVTLAGATTTYSAKVTRIGATFHGKSRSQPIVVGDLELSFDTVPTDLKPGAAVQVALGVKP